MDFSGRYVLSGQVMDDLSNKRYQDGSIIKSSDDWTESDYADYSINYPVLGVVLEVYASDHHKNKSSRDSALLRGYYWEADVLVVNDGTEGQTVLPHVVIAASGPSGIDNFSQDLPRPSSFLVDGSVYKGSLSGVDPDKLDGDRCLVQFIGGKYNQPVMTSWMPHPYNRQDPSTGGFAPTALSQGRPHLHRRNGTTLSVSNEGSIFIDTNGADSKVVGKPEGYIRESRVGGGDVQVDIKGGKRFEVNFNPPVQADNEPSLLQMNPPPSEISASERSTEKTSLYLDQDYISLIAGEVVKIIANNNDIVLTPYGNLFFGNDESTENMVLGQSWKTMMTSLMDTLIELIEFLKIHKHSTGTGPSGGILPPELAGLTGLINDDIQPLIDDIDDILSDYIFGSKETPEEEITAREIEAGEDA